MSKGYTLVEVIVAMLLTSVMVSSVFSVALTAKQSGGKSERRMAAAQASRQMMNRLKSYVTGDTASTIIAGPNANNGTNKWSLRDTTVSPNITDATTCTGTCGGVVCGAAPNVYALCPGTHTVTGILPGGLVAAPYSGTLQYYVGTETIGGQLAPQVNVTINWTEP